MKKKIKSVHSGYRDLAIDIKGFQYKSFQFRFNRPLLEICASSSGKIQKFTSFREQLANSVFLWDLASKYSLLTWGSFPSIRKFPLGLGLLLQHLWGSYYQWKNSPGTWTLTAASQGIFPPMKKFPWDLASNCSLPGDLTTNEKIPLGLGL